MPIFINSPWFRHLFVPNLSIWQCSIGSGNVSFVKTFSLLTKIKLDGAFILFLKHPHSKRFGFIILSCLCVFELCVKLNFYQSDILVLTQLVLVSEAKQSESRVLFQFNLTNGLVAYNKDFFQADAIIDQILCPNFAIFYWEWRRNICKNV